MMSKDEDWLLKNEVASVIMRLTDNIIYEYESNPENPPLEDRAEYILSKLGYEAGIVNLLQKKFPTADQKLLYRVVNDFLPQIPRYDPRSQQN
jgi:hypothetical protein